MSYISILLPAFYLQNSPEKEEIIKFCNEQFETSSDSFELIEKLTNQQIKITRLNLRKVI